MANRTILVKANGEGPFPKEGKATVEIYPGMLIQYDTNVTQVKPHATAHKQDAVMVAVENSLEAQEVGTSYAIGDQVQFMHLRPGDEFLALVASGITIAALDPMVSLGNGYWTKQTGGDSYAIEARGVIAMEAHSGVASLIRAVVV